MKVYKTLDNGIRIVEYEDSLAGALAEMWNQSGDSWGGDTEISTAEQIISTHSGGSFFNVFVAMLEDEAVGYCSFDRYYKDADTAYVHLLNVRPDFHGKKVGKELVLMCVKQTIALGYPRVDIHTWPGNTKAVPLYKKCGFLWEDRSDSTHLANYVPTVLKTELLAYFFTKADWYEDSSRVIEIKPDGVKVNKFELFEYSWEKDGESLRVGFEKTGRRMRLIETEDYIIEMMAENHELAFGLSYPCSFHVENKSGRPLCLRIDGKDDGVIGFDYHLEAEVQHAADFSAAFAVSEIAEEQDTWRMHPCVLADITINGKRAEFGLGIEPRFPLTATLVEKRLIPKIGMTQDVYINLRSSMLRDATVSFRIPDNALTRFCESEFSVPVRAGQKTVIPVKAEIIGYGHASLSIAYDIAMNDGNRVCFTKPLHIVNQGLEGMFGFETDEEHGAANGMWRLLLNKKNNNASFSRTIRSGHADFTVAKLGKPYDDEFNLIKPSCVRATENGANMIFEADFCSEKFPGAVMTEIFEFSAAGVCSRRHRVGNTSAQAQSLWLKSQMRTSIGKRPVFHYDGAIHAVKDDLAYGFEDLHAEKIDENWIFDSHPSNPSGITWPAECVPHPYWGNGLWFEHPTGELMPGECFETKPVVFMCGVFTNYKDFRNYVLGTNQESTPVAINHLEIVANEYNPVLTRERLSLTVHNHRLRVMEGEIALASDNGWFESETQHNVANQIREKNEFAPALTPEITGIRIAKLSMRTAGFDKEIPRALLIPDPKSPVETNEKDGVFTVLNGALSFAVAPRYSAAVFSMKYGDNQWLFSKYPDVVPYAWWNPFIGGIQTRLPKMSDSLVLRERIDARFAEVKDNFGNLWTGVSTSVTVDRFDEHKGCAYEQFYLTLPGIPVMCAFVKLINHTGAYLDVELSTEAFLCGKDNLSDVYAALTTVEGMSYRLRMGKEEHWQAFDRLLTVSREGARPRAEKLYVYSDATRDGGEIHIHSDISTMSFGAGIKARAKAGESCATKPVFFLLTEMELSSEALRDLERIDFSCEIEGAR